MTDFFDSPVVRAAVTELNELQDEMSRLMFRHPASLTQEDREEHLRLMKQLLEKQKLFYFRLKMSDDPKAVQMKESIMESAKFLGLEEGQPVESFFDGLTQVLVDLEERLDQPENWTEEVDEDEDWRYN